MFYVLLSSYAVANISCLFFFPIDYVISCRIVVHLSQEALETILLSCKKWDLDGK